MSESFEEQKEESRGMGARRRLLVIAVVVAAALSLGGLTATRVIKSPAELAAESKPPKASLLTAEVRKEVVSATLVVRGEVRATGQFELTPASAQGAQQLVVTGIRKPVGSTIQAGEVLLEVSGRPLIALPGDVPAYRDLKPNDEGKDVRQLQIGLRSLGFSTGADETGRFGAGTKDAVKRLYKKLGFSVATTGGVDGQQDVAALQAMQDTVTQAERRIKTLRETLVQSTTTTTTTTTPVAPARSDSAQSDSAQSDSAPSGPAPSAPTPTSTTSTTEPGQMGVGSTEQGRVIAEALLPAQEDNSSSSESIASQLADAEQDLATAKQRYAELEARTGPIVPMAEVVFLPSFPSRVAKLGARVGDPVKAPLMTVTSGSLIVEGKLDPSDGPLVKVGMKVTINAEVVGFNGEGKVALVGALVSPSVGASGSGITSEGEQSSSPGGVPYLPVEVEPDAPLDNSLIGQNVRLTIESAHSDGEVLAVPQGAISVSADGKSYVSKVGRNGRRSRVAVRAGVSGGGLVAVTPITGSLNPGDLVVTGK